MKMQLLDHSCSCSGGHTLWLTKTSCSPLSVTVTRCARSFQIYFLCVIFKYAKNLLLHTSVTVTTWVSEGERWKSIPNNIAASPASRVLPTDAISQLRKPRGSPSLSGRTTWLIGTVMDLAFFRLPIAYLPLTAQK